MSAIGWFSDNSFIEKTLPALELRSHHRVLATIFYVP